VDPTGRDRDPPQEGNDEAADHGGADRGAGDSLQGAHLAIQDEQSRLTPANGFLQTA
jgi:hypothetical protein